MEVRNANEIPVGTNLWCRCDGFVENEIHTHGVYVTVEVPDWADADQAATGEWVFIEDDHGHVQGLNYDRCFHPYDPEKPVYPWRADFRRWEEIEARRSMVTLLQEWSELGVDLIETSKSLSDDAKSKLKGYLAR